VVAEEQTDRFRSGQRRVAQGVAGLDDAVFMAAGAGSELREPQPRSGVLDVMGPA